MQMILSSLLTLLRNVSGGSFLERSHGGEWLEGKCRISKAMICDTGLGLMQRSGVFPCTVCHTGVAFTAMAANTGYIRNTDCSND